MSRARGSPTHPALAPWAPFCAAAEDSLRVDAAGVAVAELPYPYVRGVVATRPLKRGARVLSVPLPALLTAAAADEPDAAPFFAALGRPVLDGLAGEPEDATLALLLLLHRHALGERSRWAPFLRALPAEYDLPWAWRDAEVDALGGCNLHPVAVAMTAQARHDHALLAPAVAAAAAAVGAGGGPGGPAGDGDAAGDGARGARLPFALEDYVWALSTVWSRGVSLRLSARARAPVVKVLAPFFDMFNHAPASATQHAFDATRGALTVVLGAPAAPGEQLFLCYGPYTSMENVKLRGFAVPRGPHEWFQLQVLLTPREDVAARLALVRLAPPAGDFRAPSEHGVVRASYDTSSAPPALRDVQGFFELHEGAEPLALLRFARIVLAEPGDELAALGAVMREQAPDAFDDLHLEARVVQALAGAVVELLKNLQPAEGEAAAVGEWLADADAGDAAMRELTASIQRALGYEEGAGGGGGRASAEAGAGDDGAEGLASIRAPARARGGKGGKAAAAAAPAAAVATASAATASAATTAAADAAAPPPAAAPTPAASAAGADEAGTAPAPAAAAAPAPAAAPAAAPAFSRARVDAGVRRFQLASHLRATERRVLEWHLRALEAHSAQLKEIAAAHNEANAAARGDAGGGDTAGAGEPAATES